MMQLMLFRLVVYKRLRTLVEYPEMKLNKKKRKNEFVADDLCKNTELSV